MSIELEVVRDGRGLQRFVDVPHALLADDPCYVPQLSLQQRSLLDRGSAFRRHGDLHLLIAREGGRPVGRIAAIENRLYDQRHGTRQGFFGFFDCVDDAQVVRRLLDGAREWLDARGRRGLVGPVNPDMNNSAGVLVGGFDHRPRVLMPYNPPHVGPALERYGLRVLRELNAWRIRSRDVPEASLARADRVRARLERRGYRFRAIDLGDYDREMERLRAVYNDSLEGTWGHVPLTREEFAEQAQALRRLCPREFVQVALHGDEIVGFIGAAPDLNECLVHVPRGRLLPLGWWRLWRGWKQIRWTRILLYGVHREHRNSGIANWLYVALVRSIRDRGFEGAEASYVLADNRAVNDLSARLGGVVEKRYAIYGTGSDRPRESDA